MNKMPNNIVNFTAGNPERKEAYAQISAYVKAFEAGKSDVAGKEGIVSFSVANDKMLEFFKSEIEYMSGKKIADFNDLAMFCNFTDVKEAASGNGITSVRHNPGISYCVIQAHAPTERAARQVANIIRDKLTGFKPTDAGELRLSGGRTYSSVENNAVPKKYISEVAFTFIVNTVVS
jgi:hypothetical protein